MVIAHNMVGMNAQRQFNIVSTQQKKSVEKLSSGYRINRAADDAAGLAISEKMRRNIRGLSQGTRNIQDGVSYVQVADGALSEVQSMLQRINQLSVKAANATITPEDRACINEEVQHIKTEMSRIFDDTEFNNKKIWRPSPQDATSVPVQVTRPAVQFESNSISGVLNNVNKMAIPRDSSYYLSANDSGIKVDWEGYNGKKYSVDVPWKEPLEGRMRFSLADYTDTVANPELAGLNFNYSFSIDKVATKADIIDAINGQSVFCYPSTSEFVNPTKTAELSGIQFYTSIDYSALLKSGKDFDAADTAFLEGINSYQNMTPNLRVAGTENEPFKFQFDMPNIGTVTAKVSSAYYMGSTAEPDNGIWWNWEKDWMGNPYKSLNAYSAGSGSLQDILKTIDGGSGPLLKDTQSSAGGSIVLDFTLEPEAAYTQVNGRDKSTYIGGMTMYIDYSHGESTESVKNRLSKLTGVDIYDNADKTYFQTYEESRDSSNSVSEMVDSYLADGEVSIYIQSGADAWQGIDIRYDMLSLEKLGMGNTDLSTIEDANLAIGEVKNALHVVSSQRSTFGAYQNRLEASMRSNDNVVENTTAAESKIRDTDMAKEMVNLSMMNILSQADASMMSQANQSRDGILSLLQ